VENRRQCMMSYDFHITHGDRLLLVNHKITPLAMTTEGRVLLALAKGKLERIGEEIRFLIRNPKSGL